MFSSGKAKAAKAAYDKAHKAYFEYETKPASEYDPNIAKLRYIKYKEAEKKLKPWQSRGIG